MNPLDRGLPEGPGPGRRDRAGQLVPMILVAMAVMSILGIAMLYTGSQDYAQSALVVYGLRAEQFALAGLEEAQASLYDALNGYADDVPQMKKELLDNVRLWVNQGKKDGEHEINLLGRDMVKRSKALAEASDATIVEAKARFYGWRRLKYQVVKGTPGEDLFAAEKVYYHDPTRTFDQSGSLMSPHDYVGWYSITVEAKYGKMRRRLTATHDIKVLDVSPPARQFALFSYTSTKTDPNDANGPPASYAEEDLTKGGGLKVFAYGAGRILVRGPFLIEPEGVPSGAGGERPPTCATYPPESGSGQRQAWHGWAAVPAIRDGMLDRAGFSFASIGVGPRRPDRTSSWRPITQRLVGALTGSALSSLLSDDAGWYILDREDPQWYAARRPVDPANRGFSIAGDPQDAANGGFSPFVGLQWKYDKNGRQLVGDSSARLSPDKRFWVPPQDQDEFHAIEPEGGLVGVYNRVSFRRFVTWGVKDNYEVKVFDQVRTNYGYRWEKSYERSWLSKTFGDLFAVGIVFISPVIGITTLVALDALNIQPFQGSRPPPDLSLVSPGDIENVLPAGYRIYERAATRRYAKLADVLPTGPNRRPLILDGVIWVDDPSTDEGFTYRGRGLVYSGGPELTEAPRMTLPIVPKTATGTNPADAKDYLTIVYNRDEEGKTHLGDHQLELTYNPDVASGSASVLQGSVMAAQGVRPDRGKNVSVSGNYVCGLVNKARIPADASLNVRYKADLLGGVDPAANAAFQDGSWTVMALSPRVAGWYDR